MTGKRVAWVGGVFFRFEMDRLGWDTVHIPMERPGPLGWDELAERCGGPPDMVVYADRSLPPPLLGLERFPCSTVFYCIDSHIHSWYPTYGQGFDFCAVSLKDHMDWFRMRLGLDQVLWLPPMPTRGEIVPDPPPAKEWDLLFAGKVDPETTPERHRFLARLEERLPGLAVRQGVFHELFPKARLCLNIAEHGDLNFRVFEALACGACLVTPAIGHGQSELFSDGEHLFTYDPEDMDGLVALVRRLLADPDLCEKVGRAGAAEVDARHRPHHRAETLTRALEGLDMAGLVERRLAKADGILNGYLRLVYLHWAEACEEPELRQRYLAAAMGR